jgi:hypothetical protein
MNEDLKIRNAWYHMKGRCLNQKDISYKRYGGRGIKVCERWLIFENFLKDMKPTYRVGLSLDRIDNNGNYEPSNCKWSTVKQQNRNRRDNHSIIFSGLTKTVNEWAEFLGMKPSTLVMRMTHYGWSIEEALTRKVRKHGGQKVD